MLPATVKPLSTQAKFIIQGLTPEAVSRLAKDESAYSATLQKLERAVRDDGGS